MDELKKVQQVTIDYFSEKIKMFGTSPRGVDWNGDQSQIIRLEQLLKVLPDNFTGSINDLGCGYGLLYLLLKEKGFSGTFKGYDISPDMIKAAESFLTENQSTKHELYLIKDSSELRPAEYSVASGIFNLRFSASNEEWQENVIKILNDMNNNSTKGFSFNMLTSYSDKEKMKDNLFYADPLYFFDYCKRNFSRNVALLHDYEIYDFTIIVRK